MSFVTSHISKEYPQSPSSAPAIFKGTSHNSESYRLVRFGVELFDGRFGVGFGVEFTICSESESESEVA